MHRNLITTIKKLVKTVCLAMLILLPQLTIAAPQWMTEYREISILYAHDGGTILYLSGTPFDVNSVCPGRFNILTTAGNYDGKLAMLMLAYTSKIKILIYFDPDSTECSPVVGAFMYENLG